MCMCMCIWVCVCCVCMAMLGHNKQHLLPTAGASACAGSQCNFPSHIWLRAFLCGVLRIGFVVTPQLITSSRKPPKPKT
jgi:hypothetical protein